MESTESGVLTTLCFDRKAANETGKLNTLGESYKQVRLRTDL